VSRERSTLDPCPGASVKRATVLDDEQRHRTPTMWCRNSEYIDEKHPMLDRNFYYLKQLIVGTILTICQRELTFRYITAIHIGSSTMPPTNASMLVWLHDTWRMKPRHQYHPSQTPSAMLKV